MTKGIYLFPRHKQEMDYQQSVKNTKRRNVSPSYSGRGLTPLALLNIARKKIILAHNS